MPAENDILAVIMGGGQGSRLYPLTKLRAKPAVPIGGKYRLIDTTLSNCINSGIYRIAVLTQFNSVSLHRHITHTYNFDTFHTGWVQILAAEQTPDSADWYQGTADAVRKQLTEIQSAGAEHVLILAGDHLYRMDYREMAAFHAKNDADVTVAVQPIFKEDAPRFGLLKREEDGRISDFVEKPKDKETQQKFVSRDDEERPFLGSMGIYLFKTQVLVDLLNDYPDYDDFGGDVIPHAIKSLGVYGFDFEGYWRDIGTIRSFYDTNLELTLSEAPFNFFSKKSPIYTHARYLPGSTVENSHFRDVLLAEGCRIYQADITHSVIGLRSRITSGVTIKDSIIMGADSYVTEDTGGIRVGIKKNCYIEGAILDKNVRLENDVVIKPFPRGTDLDRENFIVRDGIVIIPKNTLIPSGTRITPEDV
ncbi:MAG: glucose-1-phosphate adenylyltransferase [Anaerolineae bacterium]|jgi:glucose-1-phosphate adenylyltransferase|nr:glucose-1-phosphate adenylyltransferase [Anaerolineae bacterium]MBT7071121.1 glucose-1-phosphate adenylyltransferase [Anaerolineae bacterium]MBT7326451.1 glucose-1-phosphate adenylyltransferase [Anaerolineae bacterium]